MNRTAVQNINFSFWLYKSLCCIAIAQNTRFSVRDVLRVFLIKYLLISIGLLCGTLSYSQNPAAAVTDTMNRPDTNAAADTIIHQIDSSGIKNFLLTQQILKKHPYFNYDSKPHPLPYTQKKKPEGKELYFYILAGILLIFAGFKTAFNKYFTDLMTLFFKRSLKQRQLKQQVSQDSLPSLLFNILYVIVAGFYISLLIHELHLSDIPFQKLLPYCIAFVAVTYLVKFMALKLAGWMFQVSALTDHYIFVVFLVNKIIGIVLLPVIVIAALGNIELKTVMWGLSWLALAGLFIYRFAQAFSILRKEKRISAFHFLLYLLAFEILPVMAIYKAMAGFLN